MTLAESVDSRFGNVEEWQLLIVARSRQGEQNTRNLAPIDEIADHVD